MVNRWNNFGLPQKGYRFVEVLDMEEPTETCDICSQQGIRYVHVLTHDDLPNQIKVGCECADKLVEGYDGARREAAVKKRAADRRHWTYYGWKLNEKGLSKRVGPRYVGVMLSRYQEGKYLYWIGNRGDLKPRYSAALFESSDEAKLALYDELFPGLA
jgi:hypothetical protein